MEIELLDGESVCPKCKGQGETYNHHTRYGVKYRICDRCWGARKLDWIEMAMGKPEPRFESSSSSSVSSSSYSMSSSQILKMKEVHNDTKRIYPSRFRNIGDNFRQFYVRQKRALERQFLPRRCW